MNLCSDGHKEICYEGGICPLCRVLNKKEEIERELEMVKKEMEGHKDKVAKFVEKLLQ